jgi:hypothetical protein
MPRLQPPQRRCKNHQGSFQHSRSSRQVAASAHRACRIGLRSNLSPGGHRRPRTDPTRRHLGPARFPCGGAPCQWSCPSSAEKAIVNPQLSPTDGSSICRYPGTRLGKPTGLNGAPKNDQTRRSGEYGRGNRNPGRVVIATMARCRSRYVCKRLHLTNENDHNPYVISDLRPDAVGSNRR